MIQIFPETRATDEVAFVLLYKAKIPADGGRLLNPYRTVVPFWGHTTQIPSRLSPKRDNSPKRVKLRDYLDIVGMTFIFCNIFPLYIYRHMGLGLLFSP